MTTESKTRNYVTIRSSEVLGSIVQFIPKSTLMEVLKSQHLLHEDTLLHLAINVPKICDNISKSHFDLLLRNVNLKRQWLFDCAITRGFLENAEILLKLDLYDHQRRSTLQDDQIDPSVSGNIALTEATRYGRVELVKILLKDKRVNPNNHWSNKNAFLLATANGNIELVKIFLKDKRVDPNRRKPPYQASAILSAAKNGYIELIKIFLKDKRINPNDSKQYQGTPLSAAAENGYHELVKIFLADKRIDPNYGPHRGTSISLAAKNGHTEVVKTLLKDKRVDLDYKNLYYHDTPVSLASKNGHWSIVNILLDDDRVNSNIEGMKAVGQAAKIGDEKMVSKLLKNKRIDPKTWIYPPGSIYNSPLVVASERGHMSVVDILLKDPRVDPGIQYSAIIKIAARQGNYLLVKALLKDHRVNPNSYGKFKPALIGALEHRHMHVVDILLKDPRVDPSIQNNDAIQIAAEKRNIPAIRILLKDSRVNPTVNNNHAIRHALKNSHFDVARILLEDKRVSDSVWEDDTIQLSPSIWGFD